MRDGGKGDKRRPLSVPKEQFENNWDKIFKAIPKQEGAELVFDIGDMNLDNYPIMKAISESIDYTYVERRVPEHLEDEAHELIDNWLKSKGYDSEAI
jgi:hypothetical protein